VTEPPSTEDGVEALVAEVRADPARRDELVALLREDAAVHQGRGASTTTRIRGWVLAAFADVGLPDGAVPYVLEDLENDIEPFGVAAAARATRGLTTPTPVIASALTDVLVRMRARDDAVTFESVRPRWPAAQSTSALVEVLGALRRLGDVADGERERLLDIRRQHAPTWSPAVRTALDDVIDGLSVGHCCGGHEPTATPVDDRLRDADAVAGIVLEDQDGVRTTFGEWFACRPCVVGFFYTRCPNPNKCSLTVTKLADLQARLAVAGLGRRVGVAGVTYDPGYDDAARMRSYGEARGMSFGPNAAMLRAVDGIAALREHFDLRVGYVGSIVNRHAIELCLTAPGGAPARTWARIQWDVDEVLDAASAAATPDLAHRLT
jgi:protein SCO1/2